MHAVYQVLDYKKDSALTLSHPEVYIQYGQVNWQLQFSIWNITTEVKAKDY